VMPDNSGAYLNLRQPDHYKRSFDSIRYSLRSVGDSYDAINVLNAVRGKVYPLEAALDQVERGGIGVLTPSLALIKSGSRIRLLYLDIPIGYVTANLGIRLHPKYAPHFARLIHKHFGGSLCI
jgi:hypothetical protein